MREIDETHDPKRTSFVASAGGHPDFPIQNLPFGVFRHGTGEARSGVAIGDEILDLGDALAAGLFADAAREAAEVACRPPLNDFLALGTGPRRVLRRRISALLAAGSPDETAVRGCLRLAAECAPELPVRIGDYTDFYTGIHHATAVGRLFRPEAPLLPNYKHVPIAYHGRASSILPSGTPVRRPNGQTRAPDADLPTFGPTRRLDYEVELGILVGRGNVLSRPIDVCDAREHVGGFCLLNDWSARDVQAWEYQPLGPFLAKNFASTLSPWIVTPEALEPFRVAQAPRPEGDPHPLPYLCDAADGALGAYDVALDVSIATPGLAAGGMPPHRLASSNTRSMYWTAAQMIAHHTSGGCNLRPGDLLGSGTISGPALSAAGSLLETTVGGRDAIRLPSGEERRFVEDGDEIILSARAVRDGFVPIGFGACRAAVLPARDAAPAVPAPRSVAEDAA